MHGGILESEGWHRKDGKMYHANAKKTGNCLATLLFNLIAMLFQLAGFLS